MAKKVNPPVEQSEEPFLSPKGVWLYPHFMEADEVHEKYVGHLAVDPDEAEEFTKAVEKIRRKAFVKKQGGKLVDSSPDDLKICIQDGDEWLMAQKNEPKENVIKVASGKVLITGKSSFIPKVLARGKADEKMEAVTEDHKWAKRVDWTGNEGAMFGKLLVYNGKYPSVVFRFSHVSITKFSSGSEFNPFADMREDDNDDVGSQMEDQD